MTSGALLFVQDSFVSLVVVVVVMVMLYATLRTISESRQRMRDEDEQDQRTAPQPYLSSSSDPRGFEVRAAAAVRSRPAPLTAPWDAEDAGPVDMTLYDPEAYDETPRTNLAIATYNLHGFDADVGPPDRECFYDEILVEVYDRETGHRWMARYFVTTPSGIAKLMREERWEAMLGNNHLIVLRYDVKKILDGILRQLNNAWGLPALEDHDEAIQ